MTKRSIIILLFVSLAFNLAVLGSILWVHFSRIACPAETPYGRQARTALPPHLHNVPTMWSPEIRQMHTRFNDSKIELMNELAQDPIDETNIIAIIDSSLDAQSSLERALGYRLLDIRKQMNAAEAEDYFSSRAKQMKQRTQAFKHRYNRRRTDEKDNRN
ncbi:MAG: hypothetical protein RBR69_09265 [Candidatus Cloacimonadaceae bacterium]|nr:hypothetical protein [Candidatus Cloacimonadota bacterium]MCK9179197.1 hypothetical protein [Candidatus Cloacimonadota bacterium]MCK9243591.1 hypothetical protein [Candidatus Cloacimonadota bacterium]MDD3533523.1 hypothetical protein [Candidatus Cloacimonadota bacterium]MDY0128304.1 hypothetical protein [Candidatus Cloacimonadaceae bacterium]